MKIDKQTIIERLRPEMSNLLHELKPDAKLAGKGKLLARCMFPNNHTNGDANPSLLLFLDTGGYKCQACGAKGSLFDLYGHVHGMEFKESLHALSERVGMEVNKQVQQRVTGRYDYLDANGNLAYYKLRLEPARDGKRSKEFTIKGPDGKAGQSDIPVLYQLNKLANAPKGSTVLITEGEKHADLLSRWGFLATTLPHGSGSTWNESYTKYLEQMHVAVLPDNDEVGYSYSETICHALYGKAASIKIVNLPELPVKGDVMDWTAVPGNDAKLLKKIIESTETWAGADIADDKLIQDKWPELPTEALPGLLGEFVSAACDNSEADPAAVAITFLVRFGIECGANKYVQVGESRHYARTNGVIVGESSKARKGTSAGPVKSLFKRVAEHCRSSPGPLSSGEGLIYAVRDELPEWKVDKKSDDGRWVIVDPGVEDKRLFVLDEEFANALTSANQKDNRLSAVIRTLFDDGNAEPLTKSNRTKATNAHVGLITHITLPELKQRLSATDMLNGFGNRFLWACSRRQKLVPRPEPIAEDLMLHFQESLQNRIEKARLPGEIQFSDDADELWHEVYVKLSSAYEGAAGCMVNRGEAHVTRLALIYALLAGHDQIQSNDLKAALAFWQYCLDSALFIFGQTPIDKKRQKVISALEQALDNSLSREKVRKKCFSNHIKADQLDQLLSDMEANGIITARTVQTGGAPKNIISLARVKREKRDNDISLPDF